MNDLRDDQSIRFTRWWVRRYTAGLPSQEQLWRRAEIDSELAEHARHRELDGWTTKQIASERVRRLVRGMAADLSWRHELVTSSCQTRGLARVSVLSLTSAASLTLALFHFAFAAYVLGSTSLAGQRFLGGLAAYEDAVGRPIASPVAATIIASLGVVLVLAALARPISPLIANIATSGVAVWSVLFFWLGVWPIGLVAVLGSSFDLATRTPEPTSP
jgi:hypothetical protein